MSQTNHISCNFLVQSDLNSIWNKNMFLPFSILQTCNFLQVYFFSTGTEVIRDKNKKKFHHPQFAVHKVLHMFIHKIKRYNLIRIKCNLVYNFNVCFRNNFSRYRFFFHPFRPFFSDYCNLLFGCRHCSQRAHERTRPVSQHFCTQSANAFIIYVYGQSFNNFFCLAWI